MAYAASIEGLLEILCSRAAEKVSTLDREKRRVHHGLLSVGLKLHCLGEEDLFAPLIEALGGERRALEQNLFKSSRAKFCLVLPPLGSAHAAVLLLGCLEHYTGCKMFNNPNIQLQVCSPGRLSRQNAALHAIGFYLSSDTLRQYALDDFATTVSNTPYHRGKRIVLYDAGCYSDFDAEFAWWSRKNGKLKMRSCLPFLNARTDILVGPGSRLDIHNINLLATLLVHAQSSDRDGYWSSLGQEFIRDAIALLDGHLLSGLLQAPWLGVPVTDVNPTTDHLFLSALQELTAYATAEATRLKRTNESVPTSFSSMERGARPGILDEMQRLLAKYRAIITSVSEPEGAEHA